MIREKRILVTGGAGYIGSLVVRQLLHEGFRVKVLDSLVYGGEPIVDLISNPNFEFVKGDIRNQSDVDRALTEPVEAVVHLAAVVGDPACAKQPELARSVNLDASLMLYQKANALDVQKFIFASTCSNYGKMSDPSNFVDESSPLAPVSLYAETKVAVENYLMGQTVSNVCKPTCLRFSTVYGLSLRPRFDLTVNEFTKELALGRELTVFGEQFWRPYCHVADLAASVRAVLRANPAKVAFEVFNVGDTQENYQKRMIVNEIRIQIPTAKVNYVHKNEDPRDYRVSFEKIARVLGFKVAMRVPDGIRQIRMAITEGFIVNPDDGRYKNS